jgi:hypothetical protein
MQSVKAVCEGHAGDGSVLARSGSVARVPVRATQPSHLCAHTTFSQHATRPTTLRNLCITLGVCTTLALRARARTGAVGMPSW